MPRARRRAPTLAERVTRAYSTPGHPVAYSAPSAVARYFGTSRHQAKKLLEHIPAYTSFREYKSPRVFNPYYVHNRRELAQADLIDISRLAAQNDGVRFLLIVLDVFTKRLWCYPLRRKSADHMKHAIQSWIDSLTTPFSVLNTDRGLEFTCRAVQAALRDAGTEWQPADGTMKAAVAERANKTIQMLIYKFLHDNETLRYIDALPKLIDTYNKRPHRTLEGMSPNLADLPNNEQHVQTIHHARYAKLGALRRPPKLRVGDLVTVKTQPHKITQNSRAYAIQYTGEFFRIARINRSLAVPLYFIKSLDTQELIRGGFYAEELQRLRGDIFKVERVLARRTRRGVREILVKWRHFGPNHNSWIPATNVARVYNT